MDQFTRRDFVSAALGLAALARNTSAGQAAEPLRAPEAPLSDAQILKLLQERISVRQSYGMVVGVVEQGRRRFVSAGVMGKSDGRAVDSETVFGIASVTKPFIGLLLADAVRRGEVRYDAAAASYLTDVRLPERNGRKITVLDLATHTAGLPHELPNAAAVAAAVRSPQEAKAAMYAFLASQELLAEPGRTWSYSNLGYAVLADVLERCSGEAYAALMRDRIIAPLGMSSTATTLTEEIRARRAMPHLASLEPSAEWNKPWMGSVLHSTAPDLLAFIAANLSPRTGGLASAMSQMLTIRRPAPTIHAEQAIGWYVSSSDGRPMVGHTGGGGGFTASAMFDPAIGAGVVLLSNAEFMQEDLARHILRPSLPLDVTPAETRLDVTLLTGYASDYRDDGGGIARILHDGAQLVLVMPAGHKAPLTPEDATSFFVRGYPGLTVVFELDASGNPQSLTWTLSGKATVAHRVR